MQQTLKLLGLSDKAAEVYGATLTLGTSAVKEIAAKAGLKRPTVYVYLDELIKDGFVQKITIGKKEYYQATSPKLIELRLEEHLSSLKKEMPHLEMLHSQGRGRPGVTVFEGEEGLRQIYEEVQHTKELIFWSDLSSVERMFPEAVHKISEAILSKSILTREIIADTPETRASTKRFAATAGELYTRRLATGPIFNDSAIYDNVVAFFRIQHSNLFVVRIEDPTIAETMRTLFEMAWLSAKPFR